MIGWCVCVLQRKFGGLLGGSSGGGAVNEDSDDTASSGVKVRPTFGVSFGLPSGGGGGGSYPISPYGPNPSVNPYGHSLGGGGNGLNLGLVSVNPLLSLQVSKDEFGEKIVKPWVNLHVTPNAGLVHKVGHIVHKLKSPHYYGPGYGHDYPHSYLHQHNHYHVQPPPPPPPFYGGAAAKPFYHSKPAYGGYHGGDYGDGGYYPGGYNGGGYAPEYHSYRDDDQYEDHGDYGAGNGYYGQQPYDDYDSAGPYYRSSNVTAAGGSSGSSSAGYDESPSSGVGGSPKVAFPNDRQSTGSVKFVGGQRRKREVDEVKKKKKNHAKNKVIPFIYIYIYVHVGQYSFSPDN